MLNIFNTQYGNITLYQNDIFITGSFQKGKYWDIDNLQRLKEYIDPNKNILEIGGHCGTSSLVYASFLNPGSKIFVYEPQRNMYNLLRVNIIQNNLENIIYPYNNAVFCKEMTGYMNNIDLDGGGGNVQKRYTEEQDKPCNFGGIGIGSNGEETKFITIDDNMNHDNIGFIHCDAQGAENFIFSKATETIKKYKPVILFENNAKYSKYLYNSVCSAYPEYKEESTFDIARYCIRELNYRKIIRKFGKSEDDLLVP